MERPATPLPAFFPRPTARHGRPIVPGLAAGPLQVPPIGLAADLGAREAAQAAVARELEATRRRVADNVCFDMRPAIRRIGQLIADPRGVLGSDLDLDRRDLSLLIAARAAGVAYPARGGVLAPARMTSILALAAIAGGVAAVVVAADLDPLGATGTLLHAAYVPTVAGLDVAELAGLAHRDARETSAPYVRVDGGTGTVLVLRAT